MKGFIANPGAQVVAVCDVDSTHQEQAAKIAGLGPKEACNDFRDLLDRDDIDAVVVATPDHWHVPISIAAAKVGKDIYCEKPLSLTIAEGRTLCDTVRRYGRILQTGTQQRSGNVFRYTCELVRNGRIGDLHTITVQIPANNRSCPIWHVEPVPEGFDYDMWLGPAPWAPYTTARCHYQFRFILDYSGGQITNWGAHYLDIAQWGTDTDHYGPVEIDPTGSQFPRDGLFNTATKVNVEYTYANGVKMRCITRTDGIFDGDIRFEGSKGWISADRGKMDAHSKSLLKSNIQTDEIHLYHSTDHKQNFLDCIRLRKDPIANVEIGHRSATLCHLANIAMQLGQKLRWDPAKEYFVNNEPANRMLTRSMRSPWRL
jgi:predicted dehydrogenase